MAGRRSGDTATMEIDHIGVLVRDYDAARAFARDVLGLGEPVASFEAPEHQGLAGTFFGLGAAKLELFKLDATSPGRLPDGAPSVLDHIAVTTDDLDAEQARLAALGVRFTGPALAEEITVPVTLRGKRHLWTDPATTGGYRLQITGP